MILNRPKIFDEDKEETKLEIISQFPEEIVNLSNPSMILQKVAIKLDPNLIKFIKNPTDEIIEFAINQDGCVIQYFKNPSKTLRRLAIKQNPFAVRYLKHLTEHEIKRAIYGFMEFTSDPNELDQILSDELPSFKLIKRMKKVA